MDEQGPGVSIGQLAGESGSQKGGKRGAGRLTLPRGQAALEQPSQPGQGTGSQHCMIVACSLHIKGQMLYDSLIYPVPIGVQ